MPTSTIISKDVRDLSSWIIFGLGCLLLIILSAAYFISSNIAEQRLKSDASFHLERLTRSLDSILAKHIYLPKVIAEHSELRQFLQHIDALDANDVKKVNLYLSKINGLAQTLDIYLMTPDGKTVAASNWDKDHSFMGKNFSFRPYFIQAMQNRLGRYYALGTTSQERGYYFASPVLQSSQDQAVKILGVLVVKIAIGDIESGWNYPVIDFMVTDPNGVVFIASREEWQFHSIKPLSESARKKLKQSRQFGQQAINYLEFSIDNSPEGYALLRDQRDQYFMLDRLMQPVGWRVHILLNQHGASSYILWWMFITAVVSLLLASLIYMIYQRQHERRVYETRQRESLEQKVTERTEALKQVQEELIHAGKMAALGQLSASINHELNNPLSAIRAYADNAVQFLEYDKLDITRKNLEKISQITEKMATITHQLKSFSRKSRGVIEMVSVRRSLDAALAILQAQIKSAEVTIVDKVLHDSEVFADQSWLEQILINLIKNAIDATEAQDKPFVILEVSQQHNHLLICVSDNGQGMSEEQVKHVFEPFFTTKRQSRGLGLGLSISYRLAKDMEGTLTATNNSQGGATFELQLPYNVTKKAAK